MKKELSSEETDTIKRSRTPTVVLTANGEVHTYEEAQVFGHDLNQFVTVQLLEETPRQALRRPRILQWGSAVKSHDWRKMGESIICKTDNFVPLVLPGLSVTSGSSSFSTPPQDSSNPVSECSDEHVQEAGANQPQKPKHKIKRGMSKRIRTIRWQIFLSGWRFMWQQFSKRPQLRRLLEDQKKQKLLAEDALAKLYHVQKSLATW